MFVSETTREQMDALKVRRYIIMPDKLEMIAVGQHFDMDIWMAKIKDHISLFDVVQYCKQNYVAARLISARGALYDNILRMVFNRKLKKENRLLHEHFIEAMAFVKIPDELFEEGEEISEGLLRHSENVINETYLQINRNGCK